VLGLDRELRCGHHIPDYIRPLDIGVGPVAAVIGKMQFGHGEVSSGADIHEAGLQRRGGGGVSHNLVYGAACVQDMELASRRLREVHRPTAGQRREEAGGEQNS
jgi:hypothetical protein